MLSDLLWLAVGEMLLRSLLLAALALAAGGQQQQQQKKPPNIVFVVIDDLGKHLHEYTWHLHDIPGTLTHLRGFSFSLKFKSHVGWKYVPSGFWLHLTC